MTYQPIPSFAELSLGEGDDSYFNPVWMDWFVRLSYATAFPSPPVHLSFMEKQGEVDIVSPVWVDWIVKVAEALALPSTFEPAPTFIVPIEIDRNTKRPVFHPAWIQWFTLLVA